MLKRREGEAAMPGRFPPSGRTRRSPTPPSPALGGARWGAPLPRRAGPEGESAARAGPARSHSGGAESPGPEGEPRGHGGPECEAVSKGGEAWAASVPSLPRRNVQHCWCPVGTRREVQPSAEPRLGGRGRNHTRTRARRRPPSRRTGSVPAAQGTLGS